MSLWSRLFTTPPSGVGPEAYRVVPSRSLARMLKVLAPEDEERRPEILLLGPPRGPQIEFFTHRGFRVTVEDLSEFLEWAGGCEGRDDPLPPPELAQPESRFAAAVLFDLVDRLEDDVARLLLRRVESTLRPGGFVFLVSDGRPAKGPKAPSVIVFAGEGFRVEESTGRPYRRKSRVNRDLLRLVEGLSVQQVQLRTDGLREVLLRKASP